MISQTAEYALRATVYLADQGEPRTNAQIAEVTEIPVGYLAKVMQSLSRAGIVTAQRGVRGGFRLASAAEDVTLLEVVNVLDPSRRFHECPLGLHGTKLCPLHRTLDDAAIAVENTLGDTTIADVLQAPRNRRPLCRFPNLPDPSAS